MHQRDNFFSKSVLVLFLFVVTAAMVVTAQADVSLFPDDNTIGLWLFDEMNYPHTTLTDASKYLYDLRLQDGGELLAGRFGNALKVSPDSGQSVSFAGFMGKVVCEELREKDGEPSGLWGPAVAPEKILKSFSTGDWTIELWLKLKAAPDSEVTVIDFGQAYEPGVTVNLTAGAKSFKISNFYAGLEALCSTNTKLADGKWHHAAFTCESGNVVHYFDGMEQPKAVITTIAKQKTPEVIIPQDREHDTMGFDKSKSFEWRRLHRFNFTIGHDRRGVKGLECMVDELRISDVVRYSRDFGVANSFSRNYGPGALKPSVANGPPLLFGADSPKGMVQLGSRKHLFIDGALLDSMQGVKLQCNPPTDRKDLNFGPKKSSWRASVFDKDGKVCIFIPEGYGSEKGITRLRISEDGVNFTTPNLGVVEYEGSTNNDYIFAGNPMYAMVFEDLNPNKRPEEKYKVTAWVANRGIYLYFSPDGIRWRRNETCMLPLVSGGEAETYWDDQRGLYVDFIKRDSSFKTKGCPGGGRRAVMFEAGDILKPWPFKALKEPYYEGWPLPAVTCEGPVVFGADKNGQVYRTRAIKYPWAPDTYVAFVWRFAEDEHRQIDLGVSRDGINWDFYADDTWYLTPGDAEEVLSLYGLIRRGDELWQYVDYGGAHGGSKERIYARFTQRLDGFVSLDAGEQAGTVVTRSLVFKGNKLVLNINAQDSAKVAILDESGRPITGFDISDCDLIKGDSLRQVVSFNGNSDVSSLAGRAVRVKFRLQRAKLYAMQFVSSH